MSDNNNFFTPKFFDELDLDSVIKQNNYKLNKNKYSFNEQYQEIFDTIKNQILNDYCFINNINEQNLSEEILERMHKRTIDIFKIHYPNIQLPKDILDYNFISYDHILNEIVDEKKFKSNYFEMDKNHTCFKFLIFDPKYKINQTNCFVVVVSELSVNDKKIKLQLAYDATTGICVGTPEMANRLYFEKGIKIAYALNSTRKVANLGVHKDGTWSGWVNNTFKHFKIGDRIDNDKLTIIQTSQQSKMAAILFVQNALLPQNQ